MRVQTACIPPNKRDKAIIALGLPLNPLPLPKKKEPFLSQNLDYVFYVASR